MMAATEDLVYLTPDHRYIHRESGREIVSVSKVLRVSGLRPAIFRFGRGPRRLAMQAALQRGTDVHRLARAIDETGDIEDAFEDDFDPARISAETANYVSAYQAFLDTSGFRAIAWETVVYHPAPLEYAGRIDAVGWLGHRRVIIDRKTDRALSKATYVQLAAYKRAWELSHPREPIDRTYALLLKPDMTFALLANPIEDEAWFYFAAGLWLTKWHGLQL